MTDPEKMTKEELVAVVDCVLEILWPDGDGDEEWDSETLGQVARVLDMAGLSPYSEEDRGMAVGQTHMQLDCYGD